MGLTELACRSRQEASKLLERTGVARRTTWQPHPVLSFHRFREVGPGRFFDGALSTETPRLLAERLPGARDEAIAAGQALCQRRCGLVGHPARSFCGPVRRP